MLTRSGRLVVPGGRAVPSLEDIATSLSRMPRFAGNTSCWWTVAHHSLLVDRLMRAQLRRIAHAPAEQAVARLYALLHDAHESVTGDIPTTWKTDSMRAYQRLLDDLIFPSFGLTPPHQHADPDLRAALHQLDHLALWAEGATVGPSGFAFSMPDGSGPHPARLEEARHAVEYLQMLYPDESYRGLLVADYQRVVQAMQSLLHPNAG